MDRNRAERHSVDSRDLNIFDQDITPDDRSRKLDRGGRHTEMINQDLRGTGEPGTLSPGRAGRASKVSKRVSRLETPSNFRDEISQDQGNLYGKADHSVESLINNPK